MTANLCATVLRAVLTIGFTGLPGFLAGLHGIMNFDFLQRLSQFHVGFLMPCLIFSNLGSRLSVARLALVWPLVCWSCLQMVVGLGVTRALVCLHAARPWAKPGSDTLVPLLMVGVVFQNVGAWTMPLVQSLCQVVELFPQHQEHCYEDGILMILGYSFPWDIGLWSFGYSSVLALASSVGHKTKCADAVQSDDSEDGAFTAPCVTSYGDCDASADHISCEQHCSKQHIANAWHPVRDASKRLLRKVRSLTRHLNPVLVAMISGIFVGLTPPLQAVLFGPQASLGVLGDALKRIGSPVPVVGLQILTGSLGLACANMWEKFDLHRMRSRRDEASGGQAGMMSNRPHIVTRSQLTWLVAVLVGRLACMPALCFVAVAVLRAVQMPHAVLNGSSVDELGVDLLTSPAMLSLPAWSSSAYHLWPNDQLVRAVVVMQWSAPSCLSLIVLCHRAGLSEAVVQAVSAMYLVMYGLAVVSTTGWVTAGLSFA